MSSKKKELWVDVLNEFSERMTKKGFKPFYSQSNSMPHITCTKKNRYRFELIAFLYPEPISISLKATIGTDVKTIMYFKMNDITHNTWERFNAMMNEAEQYIEYELTDYEEDRREF